MLRMTPPSRCLEINSLRARKNLSLRALASLAGVNYYAACRLLRGRMNDAKALALLERAARQAPTPKKLEAVS